MITFLIPKCFTTVNKHIQLQGVRKILLYNIMSHICVMISVLFQTKDEKLNITSSLEIKYMIRFVSILWLESLTEKTLFYAYKKIYSWYQNIVLNLFWGQKWTLHLLFGVALYFVIFKKLVRPEICSHD